MKPVAQKLSSVLPVCLFAQQILHGPVVTGLILGENCCVALTPVRRNVYDCEIEFLLGVPPLNEHNALVGWIAGPGFARIQNLPIAPADWSGLKNPEDLILHGVDFRFARFTRARGCVKTLSSPLNIPPRAVLNRVNFAHCSGVIVDVRREHGTWFDKDELRRIMEFIRADGLNKARAYEIGELKREKQKFDDVQTTGVTAGDLWNRPAPFLPTTKYDLIGWGVTDALLALGAFLR